MRNKKGLEFAIGTIVMLIMSVLIFSMAIYLVFNWFGKADVLKAEIDRQTEDQIVSALRSGNTLVAIPISLQEVGRGEAVNFGMGIRNVGAEKTFSAAVAFSGAYTPNGDTITSLTPDYIEEYWLGTFNVVNSFTLKKNEQKLIPLQVKAHTNIAENVPTPKGDYVFNVCVYPAGLTADDQPPAPCRPGQSFSAFYTEKMYQITVRVV